MSASLQGRRTTSDANMWVANSYKIMKILYDKENRYVLRRFLNVDVVGAVRMSGGKLFNAVRPATENARLCKQLFILASRTCAKILPGTDSSIIPP